MQQYDAVIIGAGFGGLSCALELAERGASVAVFERLTYPGGCASTFERKGYRFESGATLFCGFDNGQLFRRWIDDYQLDVEFQAIALLVEFRTPDFDIAVCSERSQFVDELCQLEGVDAGDVRKFFDWQQKIADALWDCFDDPTLLPPFNIHNISRHLMRSPRYLRLVRTIGQSLGDVLRRFELWDSRPIRAWADAVCQITVQTPADEAEAPFALGAMDYFFRGAGHIHGGIGELARAVSGAIEELGGDVHFADGVQNIRRQSGRWLVESRHQRVATDAVVANLLPATIAELTGRSIDDHPGLFELDQQVHTGWGAAMLYLGLDPRKVTNKRAHHLQMVGDLDELFREGNHIFCSVSDADETDRAPDRQRVATVSTHVDMNRLWNKDDDQQADYIDAIHRRMRRTLARRAPEIDGARIFEMTASPRTFERFTNRPGGYVGGIPRTTGLHNYRQIAPLEIDDDLYLVGDTVFPGQSTLAVALGGIRVAEAIG